VLSLHNKTILLGITGGIAAYKAPELVRALIKQGAQVKVVMTQAAKHFVTPTTLQAVSGHPVFISQWDDRISNGMPHIELSRNVDAILIAPASADFMAKLSLGLADDLLSAICLAKGHESDGTVLPCPLLISPAMNRQMWEHAATQRSQARLLQDGVTILGPASGDQACGEVGMGRMLEPNEICAALIAFFQPKTLQNKTVLITAGPTYEAIDPVRGITNKSSGKMGFAIAQAAVEAGAIVKLITGPVGLETPLSFLGNISRIDVVSAKEMFNAVMANLNCDVFFSVAAVADWRVTSFSEQKIKKQSASDVPTLLLEQNPDILGEVAKHINPSKTLCIGFAAETENIIEYGRKKLHSKNIPLVVANHGPSTFGQEQNQIILIDHNSEYRMGPADKLTLARQLIQQIAPRLPKKS
jgi:phosphopantothenoylcysteine decarboxylase / phosphopantothenate---cysteine ligase